jgi:hypothetical protein
VTTDARGIAIANGYWPSALDPSGRTLLSPDGHCLVTPEQALMELGLTAKEEDNE